jgi:hypothetical protein
MNEISNFIEGHFEKYMTLDTGSIPLEATDENACLAMTP